MNKYIKKQSYFWRGHVNQTELMCGTCLWNIGCICTNWWYIMLYPYNYPGNIDDKFNSVELTFTRRAWCVGRVYQ